MTLEVVLITGMSGSGKSVALRALEDAGCYCVDNLPPELLQAFVALQQQQRASRVAIAMDVRSASALPQLPQQLQALRLQGVQLHSVFLDAATDTLLRRYSETRRSHPLTQPQPPAEAAAPLPRSERHLVQAIELERELLAELREQSHVIDTSLIRAAQLQSQVKALIALPSGRLTLVFQSFAFKRGIPLDADFVFDVRMLPNPYYEAGLRELTGRDPAVARFLAQQAGVLAMQQQIADFLAHWLDAMAHDHRSYVSVGIGCTGGQHRSVYLVEQLAQQFASDWVTLKRHRELDAH